MARVGQGLKNVGTTVRPRYADPAPGATVTRTDEGKDWSNVTRIVAIGPGTISHIYYGLSGFGDTIIEKLSVSPGQYGPYIYYALESSGCHIVVRTGQPVKTGQTLADGGSGGGIECGFWNPSTGRAVSAGQPFPTAAGIAFAKLVLGGVTIPPGGITRPSTASTADPGCSTTTALLVLCLLMLGKP